MTMKRTLPLVAFTLLVLAGCSASPSTMTSTMPGRGSHSQNAYDRTQFYEKYLNPQASPLDAQIARTLGDLRSTPNSATLHNELGQGLVAKGFPKDAEKEFERSVNSDSHFYPAWYNLGLVRMSRGDWTGARFAFGRTVHYKPGHSVALFQLGLMEEQRHNVEDAVDYYAKAFAINHSLLDVRVNPRILDSKLIDLALIRMYPKEHARGTMQFQGTPWGYAWLNANASAPATLESPSPQPSGRDIVTPSAPLTNPAQQAPAPTPGQPPVPAPKPAAPPQPTTSTSH